MRLLVTFLTLAAAVFSATQETRCRVSYVAADGLFLDAGSGRGLAAGARGRVLRDGQEVATVEILSVSANSARARVLTSTREVASGDTVLVTIAVAAREKPAGRKTPGPDSPDFRPLLERFKQGANYAPRDIFRGSISLRQLFHFDGEDGLDYSTTLVGLHGSLERMRGGPWALRWSGNLGIRDGDAFSGSSLEGARLDLYELSIGRRLGKDGGHLLLGRFVPRGVPGLGYVDGAHVELTAGDGFLWGAVAGFRPTRDDLSPSGDQPLAAFYGTWTKGKRNERYLSATVAGLASFFDGDVDRFAVLPEIHAESGRLTADLSAEIDLDVGAAAVRNGTRLTRFDFRVALQATAAVRLRAGADHWEQLDNAATRDVVGADPALFDRGFWRYFAGVRAQVADGLTLDAELAQINAPGRDPTTHARLFVTIRRHQATFTVSAFTLSGNDGIDGVGVRVDAYVPAGRWTISPSVGFDSLDGFELTDLRVRADRTLNEHWSGYAAIGYVNGTAVSSTLAEFGLTYRW